MSTVRNRRTTLAFAALLGVFVATAGLSIAQLDGGTLETTGAVSVTGATEVETGNGTINLISSAVPGIALASEDVGIRTAWERGTMAQNADGDTVLFREEESAVRWWNASSVEATLSEYSSSPQVLLIPDDTEATRVWNDQDVAEVRSEQNHTLANNGFDDHDTSPKDFTGFQYAIDNPHVAFTGADRAKVVGDFTLFVNNVTIEVTDSDQGTWSNWTGYRESNPDSPAGTLENPTAKEYEVRVTTLHVTDGVLWVNATDAVDLYADEAEADVDGTVEAASVSGQLVTDPARYAFDGDPLRMWGDGELDLGLASESSTETASASAATDQAPPLALAPQGGFEVHPGQSVEVQDVEADSGFSPVSWLGPGALLGMAFLATAVVGAGIGATAPHRVHAFLGQVVGDWRKRQYDRLVRDGEMAMKAGGLDRARRYFAKATRLAPEQSAAWRLLSMARFEAGQPAEALATLREADERLDELPLPLMDLYVTYAVEAGEAEGVIEVWLRLAEANPEHAYLMCVEEGYEAFADDERVQRRMAELEEEVSLPAELRSADAGEAPAGPEVA
jgi:tetratricopeptide (TPR) repeat protein